MTGNRFAGSVAPVVLLLVLTACSGSSAPAPAASDLAVRAGNPSPAATSASAPVAEEPGATAALTGRRSSGDGDRTAVAVVLAGDHPHGLDRADIVYEEFSDQARWLALYQSADATVGPVTAARPMDSMLLSVLRPVYGYAGGPAGVLAQIHGNSVDGVDPGADPDAFHGSGDDLEASTKALRKAGSTAAAAVPLLSYVSENADPAPGMRAATKISLKVAGHPQQTWTYDARAGEWRLPAVPGLRPANLVIQFADYKRIQVKHPDGPFVPSARVFGTGRAVVATDGRALDGIWRKAGLGALTTYSTEHGVLARLKPGSTVVLLAPRAARVTLR